MIQQTTLEQVSSAVQTYYEIQQEMARLKLTQDLLRESLLQYWKEMACPNYYDTPEQLRLRVLVKSRESIGVSEARSLLPQDLFDKLLKVTQFEQVMVRKIKGGDNGLPEV